MSKYNIPVLVKGDLTRKDTGIGEEYLSPLRGTVINVAYRSPEEYAGPANDVWYWKPEHVILNPTPSQIEEEARKAGKVPVTTETREPKLYEFWELCDGRTAWLEPDRNSHPSDFIARGISGGWGPDRDCEDRSIGAGANFIRRREINRPSTPAEIEAWIAKHGKPAKYTPEAAQSAQKGNMPIETQVTKQIKETIAAKALREAMDKVKADQERVDAIRSLVALEEEKRKAKEHLKGIDDQIATLYKTLFPQGAKKGGAK